MSEPVDGMRASDRERQATVRALRGELRNGRLSDVTFVRRMMTALDARRRNELDNLVADLPSPVRRLRRRLRAFLDGLAARGPASRSGPQVTELAYPRVPGQYVIGRADDVDLHLDFASVSRRHALLAYVDSGWMITDLGSRNGTWLNGWRLPGAAPLLPGDLLDIGCCRFLVVDRLSGLDITPRLPEIASPPPGQN
jgi:hypothetical protein